MIKKIVKTGDPILRTVAKPITKFDKKVIELVTNLKDTLKVQKEPEGVGLAAPQIGVSSRVFVMVEENRNIKEVINPQIISSEKSLKKAKKVKPNKKEILEGCLSLPDYYSPLNRTSAITIKYNNISGEEITEEFKNFAAQIVQHEIDHLNGIMFVDRLLEQGQPLYKMNNGEWEEVELA